jgi:eukaryotic-like serine/threonine-protein kinase
LATDPGPAGPGVTRMLWSAPADNMTKSPSSGRGAHTPGIVGEMAGEYRLLRKLGEGGFGAVYKAEHPLLKKQAAVKVLHQVGGRDSEAVLRFVSEAQAANQIRSRHIVDIFSFGTLPDGRPFYVMDLLQGEPLDRYLRREPRVPVAATLQLLRPLAEALDAAHAAGIVHRDLKPQNIFLVWDAAGETVPKLLDFGTAKLLGESVVHTASGTPVGTPLYMSPEQARGEKVDGRADVYALGVLCHELLTGQLPISGATALVVLMAQVSSTPPRVSEVSPDLPAALDAPILQMLSKDPAARPATAGEALAGLIRAAQSAGLVVPAGMPRLPPPPVPATVGADEGEAEGDSTAPRSRASRPADDARLSRGRWVWGVAALVLVAGMGTGVVLMRRTQPPSDPVTAARPETAASPAASAAVSAAPAPAPEPTPAPPADVTLVVQGAPRGAEVLLDGVSLGATPGPIALRHGTSAIELTVAARGYEPHRLTLIPDRAQTATVTLRRKEARARAPRAGKAPAAIPRDLESPF